MSLSLRSASDRAEICKFRLYCFEVFRLLSQVLSFGELAWITLARKIWIRPLVFQVRPLVLEISLIWADSLDVRPFFPERLKNLGASFDFSVL